MEPRTVYMVAEEVLEPVVNVVWNAKHGILFKYGAVAYGVKCFGEIQSIDNDVRLGNKKGGDGVEELDEGGGGGAGWLESELIMKTEPGGWRLERRVDIVSNDYTLQEPGEDGGYGDWSEVCW